MTDSRIQLVECPRDAMQGWPHPIPTRLKIDYINVLLQVGFHTIDFGSFVSPKAIPQMADTKDVLKGLRMENSQSRLLAIVANARGAEEAIMYDEISYLGFPFSISETFQQRNTNSSIEESLRRVDDIQTLCINNRKQLVIYLSMGFGNPYGDPYNEDVLHHWAGEIAERGVNIISLADTVGLATPEQVRAALHTLVPRYPAVNFGVHLHATPDAREAKLAAAMEAGCRRVDGALKGIGGCPMAGNALVGNMNTENILFYLEERNLVPAINQEALKESLALASTIFAT